MDVSAAEARTSVEFVAQLRSLKDASGLTYRQLARKAEANGDVLPAATVASALTRMTLPRAELVRAFTRACGCGEEEIDDWLAARQRLSTGLPDPVAPVEDPGWRPRARLGTVALACVLLVVLLTASYGDSRRADVSVRADCSTVLRMGDLGDCVAEVQSLLVRAGMTLPVDGVYGPFTKMRVVAYQLHAGLFGTGTVDEDTLSALRAGRTRVETRSPEWVERRLREVFPEDPDGVVALARCLSDLDHFYVIGYKDGSRTWGLFQLTDREVVIENRADNVTALDPEWNIQAARAIWERTKSLARWSCVPR